MFRGERVERGWKVKLHYRSRECMKGQDREKRDKKRDH